MYSPWTTSMPCLFSNPSTSSPSNYHHQSSLGSSTDLDLSNPFNIAATVSPASSTWSLNSLHLNRMHEYEKKSLTDHFEPLPFCNTHNQTEQTYYPQLSQKHVIIKQMIAQKIKYQHHHHRPQKNRYDNLLSSAADRRNRRICSFCKSNGESASVYSSHVLRDAENAVECPVLMAYVCPKCGATGKSAHTIKYCTALSESERVSLPTVKLFKEGRSSSGNLNLFKK